MTLRSEWIAIAGQGLPLDPERLFPEGEGLLERRRAKGRAKLVAKLAPVLRALEPGEKVEWVARGARYGGLEYYFSGYGVAYLSNLTAIVVTDRRLLLLQIGRSGDLRDVKNQVRREHVLFAKKRFGSSFELHLADGRTLPFLGLGGPDRKRLEALFPKAGKKKAPKQAPFALEPLCPACLAPVPGAVGSAAACPSPACRIPFRSPARAARLSAFVPGVGDIYLRHFGFGALEFVGSMLALGLALHLAFDALLGPGEPGLALFMGGILVLLPRVLDYFVTLHMGRKGYVPLASKAMPGGERNLPVFPVWAHALFLAGALGLSAASVFAAQEASARAPLRDAFAEARAGRFDEALARWGEVEAAGAGDANDRARMVLALWEAGDLAGAEELLPALADVQIELALAKRIDALAAKRDAAIAAYRQGVAAVAAGDEAGGWAQVDRGLAYFRTVKRPSLPTTREEVLADLGAGADEADELEGEGVVVPAAAGGAEGRAP